MFWYKIKILLVDIIENYQLYLSIFYRLKT